MAMTANGQDQMQYGNPQEAFERALASGRLSRDDRAENHVVRYMYMGEQDGRDLFKHIDTREYLA
jgi:hypothetical protein